MRMIKNMGTLLCCVLLVFSLAACTSANNIAVVAEHLSNGDNYRIYTGEIKDIYCFDESNNKITDFTSEAFKNSNVYFDVAFDLTQDISAFTGKGTLDESAVNGTTVSFEVNEANNKALADGGFYSTVKLNSPITFAASGCTENGTNYFYIAAVSYNSVEYLSFDSGLENITAMFENE